MIRPFRLLLVCCVLCCIAFCCVEPSMAQALMPAEGFNSIRWGTDLKERSDFHPLATEGDVALYAQETGEYKLGEFGAVKVYFATRDNKFFAAYMRMRNVEMYRQLQNSLRLEFGTGNKEGDMSSEVWLWTSGDIIATLKRNKVNDASRLSYTAQGYTDADSMTTADNLFDSLNFSRMERDTWKNPKKLDLDLLRP